MRIAINPLQWLATDDGWLDFSKALPLPALLENVSSAGFTSIHAELPAGMTAVEYGAALASHGLDPAPGYFGANLEDESMREDIVRRADAQAAFHEELGLRTMFVAADMSPDAPRVVHPACGVEPNERRLAAIATTLERVGEAAHRRGVTVCLHQHIGSWIEVEDEVDWLLARLDPELVALGPDTGHLAWAGIDPVAFIQEHRDRVRAIHAKDIRKAVASAHRGRDDASYRDVVQAGLWVEPGRGDIDFGAIFQSLRETECDWAIVEVDKPDLPTPEESITACGAWAIDAARW